MSAVFNVLNPEKPKKIALIAANAAVSAQTGLRRCFWWAELTHPYYEFMEKGYQIDVFSPDGGALVADGYSDPEAQAATRPTI